MDNLSPQERSLQMSLVRQKNTKPEMLVRSLLFKLGYRYRLHRRDLPGCPDLVFPGLRKTVFVHGCFWHGHKCPLGRIPKTRVKFWTAKIYGNRDRDQKNLRRLRSLNWHCLVIWECQLKERDRLQKRLTSFLGEIRRAA